MGSRDNIEVPAKLKSATLLDKAFRAVYKVAYRAHLIMNFFLRPITVGAYVALWNDDKILLIRNSYKRVHTLPCGGVKPGEAIVNAARRELFEEVGLDLPVGEFRLVFQNINQTEFKLDHIFLFEVRLEVTPDLKPDGREVVWAGFSSSLDAMSMALFPPVREYLLQHKLDTTAR
ncbi:MAG: NUDIX hydrolase [Gammaproteobacteria bacterium]|nr:NUDIX hydrolase [Gammaproteobacteria bacterium]